MSQLPRLMEKVHRASVTGEQKYFAGGIAFFDLDGEVDTVALGHDNIADDEIGMLDGARGESGGGIVERSGLVAMVAEDRSESVGNGSLIVDDKDSGRHYFPTFPESST